MKTIICNKCKSEHPWDYNKSYKALLESNIPSRDIKCLCGNHMITIRINKNIPLTSIVSEKDNESNNRIKNIIEKRLKSTQIICQNCDKESGWYKNREHESVPLGVKKTLSCVHCCSAVLVIKGGKKEIYKSINKPKVDLGYAGRINKNIKSKPINRHTERKVKVKIDNVPLINW